MGPNHRKGMSSGGQNDVAVEVFEVLPRCLASLNDGVRPLLPTIRTGRRFNVDAVQHWFYYGSYSVEVVLLDFGLLHQHIELCLGFMSIICKNYNGSSRQKQKKERKRGKELRRHFRSGEAYLSILRLVCQLDSTPSFSLVGFVRRSDEAG